MFILSFILLYCFVYDFRLWVIIVFFGVGVLGVLCVIWFYDVKIFFGFLELDRDEF